MEDSQNALREAQLKLRQADMAALITTELDKLFEKSKLFQKNGFQQLFTKYITQDGHESVVWDEIKKPPPDSVSIQIEKY